MGYIESNLLLDENIVYKARLHSIIFWKPCALIFLGIVFLIIQPIVGAIVIASGVFALISPMIDYTTSEFGVTNKRVIIKVGFLRRRTLELLLRHVEAISVDQSVTGRILGFGSITLTGTGGVRECFITFRLRSSFAGRFKARRPRAKPSSVLTRREAGDEDNRQPPLKEIGEMVGEQRRVSAC
jgi:uncharacterized membrane protein YdbT with pleckstrin-like domain